MAQSSYQSGNTTFNYNSVGEEILSTKVIGPNSYNVTRTYDTMDRLTTLAYPDGKSTALYGYNSLSGLLQTVQLQVTTGGNTTTQNIVTGISYNPNGSLNTVTYGNGAVATNTYDPTTMLLQSQVVKDSGTTTVQSYSYTYDSVGNVVQVRDSVRGVTKTYSYDALNRMVTSNDGNGAVNYQYDQAGNITRKGNVTYTYGQNGAGSHAVTSLSDGTTMTYDANGNMTVMTALDKTLYYTYDSSNRLTMVEAVDAGTTTRYPVAAFTYDGDGGRTTKTTYLNKGVTSVTTNYVGELYESSGTAQTDFLFMGGKRIAAYDGTKYRWFIGDHLGSTSTVLDEASAVKERIEYTPWGEIKSYEKYGTSSEVAWFYFTGKRLDDETGLVYFGARYYNPKLGRFITADSMVQSPYNPQTLNRYTYCNNNPVTLIDPDGHKWKDFFNKAWDTIKYFANPLESDPFLKGIFTGNWNYAQRVVTAGVSSFITTWNIYVALASMATEVVMNSPLGHWATVEAGEHVFDNALGMRPGSAYIWSSVALRVATSLGFEKMFVSASGAKPAQAKRISSGDTEIERLRAGGDFVGDEDMFGPSLKSKGSFESEGAVVQGLSQNNQLVVSVQKTPLGVPLLKQLGAHHASANALNVSYATHLNPATYATWGVCHQAANLTLLDAGISSTVLDLGASWDMYVTTAVYGNYGGQVGSRILAGVNAYNDD